MTTRLTKPISRVSSEMVRDGSKLRELVVTVYPTGIIGIRPLGTRREEHFPIEGVYHLAIKSRLAAAKAAKKKGAK